MNPITTILHRSVLLAHPWKPQFQSLSPTSRELHLCHVITDARQERSVGKPLGCFSDLVERSIDIALGHDSAADTRQLIGDDMAKFCGIHTSTVSDNGGRRGSAARNSEP